MKTLVTTAIFFVSAALINTAEAQKIKSQERIILQESEPRTQIEIELKDGNVYVDGKKVASNDVNKSIVIIKKFGKMLKDGDAPDVEFSFKDFGNADKDIKILGNDAGAENKPLLGVSTEPSSKNDGAIVNSVNANTPAAKAELKEGDKIIKVDNLIVTNPQDLVNAIGSHKPNDEVTLTYERDGKEYKKELKLQARGNENFGGLFGEPDGENGMAMIEKMMRSFGNTDMWGNIEEDGPVKIFGGRMEKGIPSSNNPRIGAQVEERADGSGLRVVSVSKGSAAEKCGLQPEDIITNLAGSNVSNINEFGAALADAKDKKDIVIKVNRAGKAQSLYLQIEKPLRKKDF